MEHCTLEHAWKTYQSIKTVGKQSIRSDNSRWHLHIAPFFTNMQMKDIKSLTLIQFRASLEKSQLSPQTVKHCLSLLRRVMNKSIQWELFSGPMPTFDMPKFDNRRMRYLTTDEVDQLLIALKLRSTLWHDITLFALHTGLRSNEIFCLSNDQINMANRIIYVADTKSNKTRAVNLNEKSYDVALKYYSRSSSLLFSSSNKKISEVSKIYFRAVESCGFNLGVTDRRHRVVFHTLRHTFASWLVQSGQPLAVVGSLLGHTTLDMTMRYAHLAPEQGKLAVSSLINFSDKVNPIYNFKESVARA